VTTGENSFDCY